MTFFALLLTLMQAASLVPGQLERAAPFDQPANISSTTWVVLSARTGLQGEILSVEPLLGADPLLNLAVANTRRWSFSPAGVSTLPQAPVTVVFLFRTRDFFSAQPIRPAYPVKGNTDHGPLPLELTDPGYPVNSVGEGLSILQLRITPTGTVQSVRAVSDEAGLAAHTEAAVRSWRFQPAVWNANSVSGFVIVVGSYLRPVVGLAEPTPGPRPEPGPSPTTGTFTTDKPLPPSRPF